MPEPVKTNVMRVLEKAGILFKAHYYSPDGGIDGMSVAKTLGQDPDSVFKTLVTQGKSRAYYVFVIPVTGKLSLRHAAEACGEKSVEMIPQKMLLPLTGYIHGGCSPVGMKKAFPTFIDETAELFDSICVSAGKIGCQVELAPEELVRICDAQLVPLTES